MHPAARVRGADSLHGMAFAERQCKGILSGCEDHLELCACSRAGTQPCKCQKGIAPPRCSPLLCTARGLRAKILSVLFTTRAPSSVYVFGILGVWAEGAPRTRAYRFPGRERCVGAMLHHSADPKGVC